MHAQNQGSQNQVIFLVEVRFIPRDPKQILTCTRRDWHQSAPGTGYRLRRRESDELKNERAANSGNIARTNVKG